MKRNIVKYRQDVLLLQEPDQRLSLLKVSAFDIKHMRIMRALVWNHRQLNTPVLRERRKLLPVLIPAVHAPLENLIRHSKLCIQICCIQLARQIG